jgi:glucosamine-6-phosphate deaminase
MKLERPGDGEDVARRAADVVQALIARKPDAVILVPAGRTPVPLYRELVRRVRAGTLDLGRAHFFQLDELEGVDVGDARGFQAFLRRELLEPAGVDDEHAHLLDGRAGAAGIERHARELTALGADLALLGIGRNGHVAFNEPGTPADAGGRVVELASATRTGLTHVFPADEVPRRGLTLGLREIRSAGTIALIATGASKAEILARLAGCAQGEATPDLPASLLVDHADFRVLADADAARLVAGEPV